MWWYRNNDPAGPGDEFARTDQYKYYRDGRFYDLSKDPLEENLPISLDRLTEKQKKVQLKLQKIIDENTRPEFYENKIKSE